jgi:hypothetical protein
MVTHTILRLYAVPANHDPGLCSERASTWEVRLQGRSEVVTDLAGGLDTISALLPIFPTTTCGNQILRRGI